MILSGKVVADEIHETLKKQITVLPTPPGIAVILVGADPSSQTYVNMKRRACEKVGILSFFHHLPESTSEERLLELVKECNKNQAVHGILVQLPLPKHIDPVKVILTIDPQKDVDGFHPQNLGKLLAGLEGGFIPCTPLGIQTLLKWYDLSVEGKHVVIAGRSAIVGKPLAALWMQNASGCNATVTVVHRKTHNLQEFTKQADILVAAVGIPRLIKEDMVKEGAIVIDVGVNREEAHLVGDVDFENVEKKCQAITPVPKGVGPMTVAMLLHNTLLSYQRLYS